MTFGIEAHWWKRPTFEKDLFLFLLTAGFLTVWVDRKIISEVMRRELRIKQEIRDAVSPSYGEHPNVPEEMQ